MFKLKEVYKTLNEFDPDNEFFCREGCPEFAIALHDLLGYDIKLLIDQAGEYDNEMPGDKREIFPMMAHVFGEDENGNTFDVHGQRLVSEMISQFDLRDPVVRDTTKKELVSNYMGVGKPFYGLDEEALEASKEIIQNNPEKYKL